MNEAILHLFTWLEKPRSDKDFRITVTYKNYIDFWQLRDCSLVKCWCWGKMTKWKRRGRAAVLLPGYVDSCDLIQSALSQRCSVFSGGWWGTKGERDVLQRRREQRGQERDIEKWQRRGWRAGLWEFVEELSWFAVRTHVFCLLFHLTMQALSCSASSVCLYLYC